MKRQIVFAYARDVLKCHSVVDLAHGVRTEFKKFGCLAHTLPMNAALIVFPTNASTIRGHNFENVENIKKVESVSSYIEPHVKNDVGSLAVCPPVSGYEVTLVLPKSEIEKDRTFMRSITIGEGNEIVVRFQCRPNAEVTEYEIRSLVEQWLDVAQTQLDERILGAAIVGWSKRAEDLCCHMKVGRHTITSWLYFYFLQREKLGRRKFDQIRFEPA